MKDESKTKAQLIQEIQDLRKQLSYQKDFQSDQIGPESKIFEREQTLQALLNATTESALLVDLEGSILAVNEIAAQRLGAKADELIGMGMYEYLPPDLAQTRRAQGDQVIQSKQLVCFQDERGGRVFDNTIYPVLDAAGKVNALAVYANDITEREQAKGALQKSEQKFRLLFDSMNQGIAVHEIVNDNSGNAVDYTVLDVNPAYESIVGLAKEDVLEKQATELYGLKEAPYLEVYAQVAETGQPVHFETYYPPLEKHFSISAFSHYKDSFVTVFTDITDRKQAEEALRESEEKYRNLIERAYDGIIISQQEKVVLSNSMLAEILGYSLDELDGIPFMKLIHPDERDHVAAIHRQRLAGEHVSNIYEVAALHKNGSKVDVEINTGTITYHGEVAFLSTFRDITERKRSEQVLHALNRAALAMEEAITPEEIFEAVAAELKELGFTCVLFPLDETKTRLSILYSSLIPNALRAAEKLAGLTAATHSFPVDNVDIYAEILRSRQPVFNPDEETIIRQALPRGIKKLAKQLAKLLKIPKSISSPLIVGDEVLGIFSVQSDDLTEDDIPAVSAFANQVAAAWRRAQLYERAQKEIQARKETEGKLRQRTEDLALISRVNAALNRGAELGEVLDLFSGETGRMFNSPGAAVYLLDDDQKHLVLQNMPLKSNLISKIEGLIGKRLPAIKLPVMPDSITYPILESGQTELYDSADQIDNWIQEHLSLGADLGVRLNAQIRKALTKLIQQLGYQSMLMVPLVSGDEVIGLINIARKALFAKEEVDRFETIAGQITAAIHRKQAEEALQQSEEKFSKAFMASPDSILISTPKDGRIVEANEGFERISGYSVEEAIGKTSIELGLWADDVDRSRMVDLLEKEGSARDLEILFKAKDGTEKTCLISAETFELHEEQYLISIVRDISARRKAEKALEESEERYRLLISNIPDVTWISSNEGKTTFISPNVEEVYGYSPDEIYQAGEELWFKRIHPEDLDTVQEAYSQLFIGEGGFDIEYRIKRKDGQWIWLHDRAITSYEKEGQQFAYGVFSDITERKQAEEALRESEEKFSKIFQFSPNSITIGTIGDDRLLDVNDAFFNITGYSRAEVLGKTSPELDLWTVSERDRIYQIFEKEGLVRDEEVQFRLKDGSFRHFQFSAVPFEFLGETYVVTISTDITERKRAEDALRESETKLHAIFDHHYQLTGLLDRQGRLLAANRTALEFAGVDESDVLGEYFWEGPWWDRSQESEIREAVGRAADGEFVRFETTHPAKDGRIHYMDFSLSPIKDDSGNVIYIVPEGRDVTEIKQAEAALRESEERYRAIFEDAAIGIALVDMDGKTFARNPALYKMLGYRPEEMEELTFADITHPDDVDLERTYFQELVKGERQNYQLEKRYIHKDGDIIWGRLTVSLVHDADQKPLFAVGMIEDITQRKQAEVALRESEQRFREMADLLPQTIYETDQNGIITFANNAALTSFGYTLEDLDMGLDMMELIIPEERERAQLNTAARSKGEERKLSNEYTALRKDGSTFPILTYADPIFREGEYAGLRGISVDITESKAAEETLRQSEEKFSRLFETSPNALIISSLEEGRIIEINEAGAQAIGLPREEIIGRTSLEIGLVDAEQRAQLIGYIQEKGYYEAVEIPVNLPDGSQRFGLFYGQLIKIGDQDCLFQTTVDITDRKQAEEALRESEEQYRLLVTNIPDVVWLSDFDGNPVFTSPVVEEVYGYSVNEVHQGGRELWYKTVHPDDLEKVQAAHRALAEEQAQFDIEYRVKRKNGEWIWVHDRAIRSYTEGGTGYAYGMFSDITDRKQAEEALRESELVYRTLFESSADAINMLDKDKFLGCNQQTLRLFGIKDEAEFIGLHPSELSPQQQPDGTDSVTAASEHIETALKKGQNKFEWLHRRKDGEEFLAEVSLTAFPYKGQKILQSIVRDITDRKRAEDALRESEARFRTLLETSPDGILIDQLGQLVYANPAYLQMFGIDNLPDRLGKPYSPIIAPQDRDRVMTISAAREAGETAPTTYEFNGKRTDGAEFPVEVTAARFEHEGHPATMAILRDITERKKAESERQQLFQDVADSQAKLKALSSELVKTQERERHSISRDLHDDIGQEISAVSYLMEHMKTTTKDPECEDDIGKALAMLDGTLQKVRDMSLNLRPAMLDTLGLAATVRWFIGRQSELVKLTIHLNDDDLVERPPVEIEIVGFRIVQESLTNIIRHAKAKNVEVVLSESENELHLLIRDDGKGFDVEEALSAASAGKSLGLLGMQERAELVGGRIELTSKHAQGTEIHAYFPLG